MVGIDKQYIKYMVYSFILYLQNCIMNAEELFEINKMLWKNIIIRCQRLYLEQ